MQAGSFHIMFFFSHIFHQFIIFLKFCPVKNKQKSQKIRYPLSANSSVQLGISYNFKYEEETPPYVEIYPFFLWSCLCYPLTNRP